MTYTFELIKMLVIDGKRSETWVLLPPVHLLSCLATATFSQKLFLLLLLLLSFYFFAYLVDAGRGKLLPLSLHMTVFFDSCVHGFDGIYIFWRAWTDLISFGLDRFQSLAEFQSRWVDSMAWPFVLPHCLDLETLYSSIDRVAPIVLLDLLNIRSLV